MADDGDAKAWKQQLACNRDGIPYGDERNVMIALTHAPPLTGRLRFDDFADRIEVVKPLPWINVDPLDQFFDDWQPQVWREEDRIELQMWLQTSGVRVTKPNVVQDAVIAMAKRSAFHPVRNWLALIRGQWDGKPRVNTWLKTYLGASDDPTYLEEIGPKFLIGCVARILEPGCQMDNMLVLEGPQGLGKTTMVRVLSRGWCADVSTDLNNKDAAINIQGIWFGEISELTAIARSQVETVKGFISRRVDRYRPPYARNSVDRGRQTVFIATTNEVEYLQDRTGNRRFWPVQCTAIDIGALERDCEQLWAEAYERYALRQPWHLSREGELLAHREQQFRRRIDPIETTVLQYADKKRRSGSLRIEMTELLVEGMGQERGDIGQHTGGLARQASQVLCANGWVRGKPTGRGKTRRVIYVYRAERDPDPGAYDNDAIAAMEVK